jgi:hypothetical protein
LCFSFSEDIQKQKKLFETFSMDFASFYIFLTTKFENIQVFSNNIINDPTPLTIPTSPKINGLGDFIFKIIHQSAHKYLQVFQPQ